MATTVLVYACALCCAVLAWVVARRRPPRARLVGRHVALGLPLLAPERYCACGACGQLAAPGAWLADWHYEVPEALAVNKAPDDAIGIRGIAWTLSPQGSWEPAVVYVLGPDAHHRRRGAPSSNGQASPMRGNDDVSR